ncbi:two-component system sensor histidine kinase NtrB [Bacillus sp. DJP31]|uniref:two-component system sensor histidine kinase NtrB n=1 Tax=Bacillus sp. DJP31 TaxID=3409789 RepID=UPI003BB76F4C
MKETNVTRDIILEELEEEIQAYRELLSQLPFSFCYKDFKRGLKIHNDSRQTYPIVSSLIKEDIPSTLVSDLSIEKDIPFEEIEQFITPIFDTIPHHIVFIDDQGLITLCNQKAAEDLNVDRDSIIGCHIRELLHLPDDLIMLLETLSSEKPIFNREVLDTNYGVNNTRIYYDRNGKVKRVLGSFQFLNMVKEAEKQALAGRIAAGIAHEIRNPLTTVRGYLQFLTDKFSPEISKLVTSLLIPELDRANKIITDFLTIAKPSDTKFELVNTNTYICDDLGAFLRSEAFLHNVDIDFICSVEVDNCYISINTSEILQIFINLYRNALDAKSKKHLMLTIETKLIQQRVQIIFRDNGTGISPSDLEHVFEPFFTTKDEGTGLGLSVSRKMVENHGGTISVRSSQTGTAFYIQLPYIKRKAPF